MGEKSASLVSILSATLQKHLRRTLQLDKFSNMQPRWHKIEITYIVENSTTVHIILMYCSVM